MLRHKIRKARLYSGKKQQEMADLLGISISTYCRIENGPSKISRELVKQISKILNINENELMKFWLSDELYDLIKSNPEVASEAVEIVMSHLNDYDTLIMKPDRRRPKNIYNTHKTNDAKKV